MSFFERVSNMQVFKFLVGGVLNTALTYIVYFLMFVISGNYVVSYVISFAFGIVFTSFFNINHVFDSENSVKYYIVYSLYYISYFLCNMSMISILIEMFEVNELLAPIFVMIVAVPINFVISRKILT